MILIFLALTTPALAQPLPYGSADDPWEQIQQRWWRRDNTFDVRGGLALIGPQWYAGTTVGTNVALRTLTARLETSFYGNTLGVYTPSFDEPYDVLRTLVFARYHPSPTIPLYLRIGPAERVRMGTTGHLVNFFNSRVAWDERTIGAEFYTETPYGIVSGFIDNLLFNGAVGAHYAVRPLQRLASGRVASTTLGVSYLTDMRSWHADRRNLTAFALEAQFDLFEAGTVRLSPFGSVARYVDHGVGTALGVDVHSRNFIDLARFRIRLAVFYNGNEFINGYVGPFYTINNADTRILDTSSGMTVDTTYAGVLLKDASGGPDLVTEFRVLFFERFELWYYFRRHYGLQPLSSFHLHLFIRSPGGFRFQIGQDRGGLDDYGSLFSPLNDQTSLVFKADYPFGERLWLFVRSRYTYEHSGTARDGTEQYLVERRFEPSVGLRFVY